MKNQIKLLENRLELSDEINKATLHNQLSTSYTYKDIDKMYVHCTAALDLSNKHDQCNEKSIAYFNLGLYHLIKDDIKVSVDYFHQSLLLCDKDNIITKVKTYIRISVIYAHLHAFDKAHLYAEKSLHLLTHHKQPIELCDTYLNIARIHRYLEEHDIADYYYKESITIAKQYGLKNTEPLLRMSLLSNRLHTFDLNVEKELLFLESHIEENDDLWFLGPSKILWATYYILSDAHDVAQINYDIGLQILEEERQISCLLPAYLNLTFALEYKGHYDDAEALFDRAIKYFEVNKLTLSLPKLYLAASKFYSNQGKIALYQKYLRQYVALKEEFENYMNFYF